MEDYYTTFKNKRDAKTAKEVLEEKMPSPRAPLKNFRYLLELDYQFGNS
jgi:hypothetical protein